MRAGLCPASSCYRTSDFVTAKSDLLAGEKYCTVIGIVRELAEGPSIQRGVCFVSHLIHQHGLQLKVLLPLLFTHREYWNE
jgi:hypothetical protein